MSISFDSVEVGTELPPLETVLRRVDLIRYAGASGDFNVIHWNERVATSVGLPNVIAHGMLTMGRAVAIVTQWTGDPASVVSYGVKFTRPVPVADDDEGSTLSITAKVGALLDDRRVRVDITASFDGATVLGKAQAVVQLA